MDLSDLVKSMLTPGSSGFLLLGLTAGLVLLAWGERPRRWGARWLTLLAAAYWILALPATASALESMLDSGWLPLSQTSGVEGRAVIIVMGGGGDTYRAGTMAFSAPGEASALRAMEGARVYGLLDDALVIASGGPGGESGRGEAESRMLRSVLEANGVPGARIREESLSSSTREEALLLAEMLAGMDADHVIVVTSPSHLRRALGALAAVGIRAVGSPSREHNETRASAPPFLPSEGGLKDSRQAMREILALVYYAARGWLAPVAVP